MSNENRPIRVLFVCLGNICRSPLAEGVFQHLVEDRGLSKRYDIDSAGTGAWHVGEPADRRMRQTARSHGVELTGRARQFTAADLQEFDYVFAMDKSNLHDMLFLDRDQRFGDKVQLFRQFDPEPGDYQVPDPYYGGEEGFENVFRIVDRTSRALLDALQAHHE